ncbi:hypothetical protein AB0P15_34370 [Streptomyces sp. NPDC087917]|uniref:hypothetical protein n=1 Tax=unclassified Streptomyces TaxID=2593676 RepID=UPI0034275797
MNSTARTRTSPVEDDAPFARRAASVFGRAGGEVRWPYGMSPPPPPRSGSEDADALDRHRAASSDRRAAQETITNWAQAYGLRQSLSGCCPRWLQRRRSRRCQPWDCTHYGGGAPDHDWLDHLTVWTREGRPAVLTTAPYEVTPDDEARLRWWTQQDARLAVARGAGWYGSGTSQIVVWRGDLLPEVRPA